jgi:hypothetical protein
MIGPPELRTAGEPTLKVVSAFMPPILSPLPLPVQTGDLQRRQYTCNAGQRFLAQALQSRQIG